MSAEERSPARARAMWSLPSEVEGDWARRRKLAAAVRELVEHTARVHGGDLDAAEAHVRAAIDALPLGRTAAEAFRAGDFLADSRPWIDRTAVMGHTNPQAPPLVLTHDDRSSTGTVVLGERFVGAPGLVHGGVIAAIFDQVCGTCAVMADLPGLTVELNVRYLKPAHVHTALTFTATITSHTGRRVLVDGTCVEGDETVATCRATFVTLQGDRSDLFSGS